MGTCRNFVFILGSRISHYLERASFIRKGNTYFHKNAVMISFSILNIALLITRYTSFVLFFQIIWFTALFPYFVMAILLVRALTLPGAFTGLYYYVRVDWSRLLMGQTWIDGATQIFFAYSCGMGALPALGSYNKFHHNCYK